MKKHIKKNIIFEDVAQFFIALVAGEWQSQALGGFEDWGIINAVEDWGDKKW
jgi:hypothetical protein